MLTKEIVESLTLLNVLSEIPTRELTIEESEKLASLQREVREASSDIVPQLVAPVLSEMQFRLQEDVNSKNYFEFYFLELYKDGLKPPAMAKLTTQEGLNQAIIHLYGAITTVSGFIEYLEPQLKYLQSALDRIHKLSKCVIQTKTEWRGQALIEMYIPEELMRIHSRLAELVHTLKLRKEVLDNSLTIVSRLITLRMQTPTQEITRFDAETLGRNQANRSLIRPTNRV
jgi:hypothetical protein